LILGNSESDNVFFSTLKIPAKLKQNQSAKIVYIIIYVSYKTLYQNIVRPDDITLWILIVKSDSVVPRDHLLYPQNVSDDSLESRNIDGTKTHIFVRRCFRYIYTSISYISFIYLLHTGFYTGMYNVLYIICISVMSNKYFCIFQCRL